MSGSKPQTDVLNGPARSQLTLGQMGMWVFISTEVMLFLALIASSLIIRLSTLGTGWPTAADMNVELWTGMLNTVLLVLSGVSVFSAVTAARSDRSAMARLYLLITIALGTGFMFIKFHEYQHKFELGLMPSMRERQIYQRADRQYISAVDQRLRDLISWYEETGTGSQAPDSEKETLEWLYRLRAHMTGYTANFVGRGNDSHISDSQMRLMAHQVYPFVDTTRGMEETLTLDLVRLRELQDKLQTRLEIARQRIPVIEEQVVEASKAVQESILLGTAETEASELPSDQQPRKWLEVKQDQLKQIRVEIEKLELAIDPVSGRLQMLEYIGDPAYEDGFNQALKLRLPVVVTNGQAWMSVYLLLTGMHSIHLAGGLLVLLLYLPRRLGRENAAGLYVAAMYWQFVDVVWLILFWLIYF